MWFLSPSGWPTHAADGSLFAVSLAARGWQVIDEGAVQAAIDAYQAGAPAPPAAVDYLTESELLAMQQDPGSDLSVAQRAALVPRDELVLSPSAPTAPVPGTVWINTSTAA